MASLRNAIQIISNSTFPSGRECCLEHCLLFLPHVLLGRLKKRPQILNNCLTSFHLSLVTMQLRVRVASFSRNHRRLWVHICVCAFTTLAVVCAPPYSFILTNSLCKPIQILYGTKGSVTKYIGAWRVTRTQPAACSWSHWGQNLGDRLVNVARGTRLWHHDYQNSQKTVLLS